jgi:8-oxo-dGTP diphosphatase
MGVERGLRRVAGVILYRDGKVLLQHRDDKPEIFSPGAWSIFGGKLEDAEEPEDGARREIEEELGLVLKGPLALIHHDTDEVRERFFYAAPLPVPPEALTLMEGQGMALLAREELEGRALVVNQRAVLEAFFHDHLPRL